MVRKVATLGIALGAVLAVTGVVNAGDNPPLKSSYSGGAAGGATTTLMGAGTAATAAKAADTEETWCHRCWCHRGFYGGWGWGYPVAAPIAVGYYPPAPIAVPYTTGFYRPFAPAVGIRVGPVAVGVGINGGAGDRSAPALSLGTPAAQTAQRPFLGNPAQAPRNGFYDGGPVSPVPPTRDEPKTQAVPTLPADGLPVSLSKTKPAPAAKPYAYKGYGEK